MYEIEAKAVLFLGPSEASIREAAREAREKLISLGARERDHRVQTDLYLEHPSLDYRLTDEAFRIRCQEWRGEGRRNMELTYKGPRISERTKTRIEHEVPLGPEASREEALTLFGSLGFNFSREVVKERWTFDHGEMVLCVDVVLGLGAFMEAEVMGDDIEDGEGRILTFLGENGWRDIENRSYMELLEGGQS